MCTRCIRFMEEVAQGPRARHARARQPERDHRRPGPEARRALHVHDRARLPRRRAHDEGLPLQGAGLVPPHAPRASARAARRAATPTSTTTRATTRPTGTARATTRPSTSTGCATRGCSPTSARTRDALRGQLGGRVAGDAAALEAAKKLFEGVAKERVAVVLSAQHSLEDNWALLELARASLGTKNIYCSKAAGRLRGQDPHPQGQELEHGGRARARAGREAVRDAHRRRRGGARDARHRARLGDPARDRGRRRRPEGARARS